MKKIIPVLLSLIILVGCTAAGNNQSSGPVPSESDTVSASESALQPSESAEDMGPTAPADVTMVETDDIKMLVELSKADYTTDEVIDLTVTIINKSDHVIILPKGSGSALVPDALKIEMGGFNPMYVPEIATTDFQVETLDAGGTLQYDCPFAPYIPNNGEFVTGTDHDIDFFKNGEFTAANPGAVAGNVSLKYTVVTDESIDYLQDNAQSEITAAVTVNIV